ncbi:MAG: ATP phosphoribosyltransferase [Actinobacteria bacterium]|nr:ATP phosphoribosyltransferase [Actinomycetota bacterium]
MLKIAIPKGSLEEKTIELFKDADLSILRESRNYFGKVEDPRISQVRFLRPQEIPVYVSEGYFDLGISGYDCIVETEADVQILADLPFSRATSKPVKMVVAVPEDSNINKPEDIPDGSRVTTEFPNITRKYFEKIGKSVKVYYSHGATEAKVPDIMDVVVDLTETGETLRRNRLKIIDVILESTTKLFANKESLKDSSKRKAIEEIKTLLLGVIEARGRVLLSMNVHKDNLERVISVLPAMKNPTVNQLHESDYFEIVTVAEKANVNILLPMLKEMGAEDILEIPITKIIK